MEEAKLNVVRIYRGIAESINLKTVPYIGQYGTPYQLMSPLTILKPIDREIVKHMPAKLKNTITNFSKKFPKGEIDFFVINHNAIDFVPFIPLTPVRLNYIVHPYVFYNSHGPYEYKAFINMSLYKVNEEDPVYSTNEHTGMPIDATNIFDEGCSREVYIHPSNKKGVMCISPDNSAFNLVFTPPAIAFYGCCLVTYKDYRRLMVTLHTLFTNYKALINEHFNSHLNSFEITEESNVIYANGIPPLLDIWSEHVKNIFGAEVQRLVNDYNMVQEEEALKVTLFSIGMKLSCAERDTTEKEGKLAEAFISSFYQTQWITFIKQYIKELPSKYYPKLLKKFMHEIINNFRNIFKLHCDLLNSKKVIMRQKLYIDPKILKRQEKMFVKNEFMEEIGKRVNPDIEILNECIKVLREDKEKAKNLFENLSEFIRNLIFYKTWVVKGEPKGIHDKFGEYSYLERKEIDPKYYLSLEEKLDVLKSILSALVIIDE